ncbi:hypothetical protein Tco_0103878 [Tanacetum coccineum]
MAKLNQLGIDSKSELLSEQVLLYVERKMHRELRMTRILTDLCHEVTDAVKDKAELIKILRAEDLDKAKGIMNLIKETQKHTRGRYVYIAKVKLDRK